MKGNSYLSGLKNGGGIVGAPSLFKFLQKQQQQQQQTMLKKVKEKLEEAQQQKELELVKMQYDEMSCWPSSSDLSISYAWTWTTTPALNPVNTAKMDTPIKNILFKDSKGGKGLNMLNRDVLEYVKQKGYLPLAFDIVRDTRKFNYQAYVTTNPGADSTSVAAYETVKRYGFTSAEVNMFIRLNDRSLWSFSDFAKIIERLPIPHSAEYTPEREKMEIDFLYRAFYELIKYDSRNPVCVTFDFFGVDVCGYAKPSDILEIIAEEDVPFPEISRQALNAN